MKTVVGLKIEPGSIFLKTVKGQNFPRTVFTFLQYESLSKVLGSGVKTKVGTVFEIEIDRTGESV